MPIPDRKSKYVTRDVGKRFITPISEKSIVKQSFAAACDINRIMSKYTYTDMLARFKEMVIAGAVPFGDASTVTDYHTAVNMINAADEAFMTLPADLRSRFDNEPGKLIAFLSDVKNRDEAVKLGLVVKKDVAAPEAPKGGEVK